MKGNPVYDVSFATMVEEKSEDLSAVLKSSFWKK